MEAPLLCPPRLEHAATPPPPPTGDVDAPSVAPGHIRWDLRSPRDRQHGAGSTSRDTSPFGSTPDLDTTVSTALTRPTRPKLTLVTPAPDKGDCIVEVSALPSGSTTATNSGTPPSTTSTFGKPRRPLLSRDNNTPSSISTPSRKRRWLFLSPRQSRRPDAPIPASPHTPLHLPRRLSRLPSFFTRERLYLPTHIQRRDIILLAMSGAMALAFTGLGVFAAVRPQTVCDSKFLQSCVDALLPGLFIGAPYTIFVVAIAVSGWGKSWIKGRYTPLLYVLAATLGKVGIGALIANLDWTVLAC